MTTYVDANGMVMTVVTGDGEATMYNNGDWRNPLYVDKD